MQAQAQGWEIRSSAPAAVIQSRSADGKSPPYRSQLADKGRAKTLFCDDDDGDDGDKHGDDDDHDDHDQDADLISFF